MSELRQQEAEMQAAQCDRVRRKALTHTPLPPPPPHPRTIPKYPARRIRKEKTSHGGDSRGGRAMFGVLSRPQRPGGGGVQQTKQQDTCSKARPAGGGARGQSCRGSRDKWETPLTASTLALLHYAVQCVALRCPMAANRQQAGCVGVAPTTTTTTLPPAPRAPPPSPHLGTGSMAT